MPDIKCYTDILLYKGIFYADSAIIEETQLHNRMTVPFKPSDSALLRDLSLNIIDYNKIILYLEGFHSNMGHLLWDFMYPSWYGLFSNNEDDYNRDFQWMATDKMYEQYSSGWHVDILEQFSGNKITTPKLLSSSDVALKIPLLIVGCRGIGIGCVNRQLLANREHKNHDRDPIEQFVNRMYERYGIPRSVAATPINIIYIVNKRPYRNIEKVLAEIQKENSEICKTQIVDWARYSFRDQLAILNKTGIIICGVGTARANTPFLPNGAIEIQTNTHSLSFPNNINFFDYHIGTLSKHVKVFNITNYTTEESRNLLCAAQLKETVTSALQQFPIKGPIDVNENVPLAVRELQPKIPEALFNHWRKSGSNDIGDVMKLLAQKRF